jgi:hypothetical protein
LEVVDVDSVPVPDVAIVRGLSVVPMLEAASDTTPLPLTEMSLAALEDDVIGPVAMRETAPSAVVNAAEPEKDIEAAADTLRKLFPVNPALLGKVTLPALALSSVIVMLSE